MIIHNRIVKDYNTAVDDLIDLISAFLLLKNRIMVVCSSEYDKKLLYKTIKKRTNLIDNLQTTDLIFLDLRLLNVNLTAFNHQPETIIFYCVGEFALEVKKFEKYKVYSIDIVEIPNAS